jgi:hypothetical protein
MRSMPVVFALVCLAGASAPLAAQGPAPRPGVTFLLSHTGSLELTDAQVVKLAAIARRQADRHKAMRASFDSARAQWKGRAGARDTSMAGRSDRMAGAMAAMKKEHDAMHADLRDAIAVLNADQQAKAWELISMRHKHWGGPRRGGRDGHGGGMQMQRRGPGGPGGPGRRADNESGDDDTGAMDAADDDMPDDAPAPPGR